MKKKDVVIAFIRSIDVFGEVTIEFNGNMRTTNPNVSVSEINSTIIDAYIQPENQWHLTKKNFNMSKLNFTWECTFYEY